MTDITTAIQLLPHAPIIGIIIIGLGKIINPILCGKQECDPKTHRAVPLILLFLGIIMGISLRSNSYGAIEGLFGALIGMGIYSATKHTIKK